MNAGRTVAFANQPMNPEPHTSPAEAVLRVSEVFLSLQGESTFAGLPCIFIRLTGCPLRCSYCDTAYAFTGGEARPMAQLQAEIAQMASIFKAAVTPRLPLVELTGGEPLAQPGALPLMTWLCDQGFTVLLETSGALDISPVDSRVRRIVDIKCPGSGEAERNRWENLPGLRATDEVKFVISSRQDYAWAKELLGRLQLPCPVLFSWASPPRLPTDRALLKSLPEGHEPITRRELAESIVRDGLAVRFQIQLHKEIWPPEARGV